MGEKGKKSMYHYITDQEFLKKLKSTCSDIVNQLVQEINKDSVMKVKMELVGSGAKDLITQNENMSVDLDYNLIIISSTITNEHKIKKYVMRRFNFVLNRNSWGPCEDSRSVITTEERVFKEGNKTPFKIDLAIIKEDKNGRHRLVNKKQGNESRENYCWNLAPSTKGFDKKVQYLKGRNHWLEIEKVYLDKKNMYLRRNDHDHPSFIVYIETINELYKKYN